MQFDVHVFVDSLFSGTFARAAGLTVATTVCSICIAAVLGTLLAFGRSSTHRLLRSASVVYIYVGRAIPTLLWLLLVWDALPQVLPVFRAGWFTPFIGAVVALSLNEAAYMAEIIRGGLLAIDKGQRLAGRVLGMTPLQVVSKIELPQAVKVILPAAGNEFIALLKLTSLASVISLSELLTVTAQQVAVSFRFAELYLAAAVWYLVIVSVLVLLQQRVERRFRWESIGAPQYCPSRPRLALESLMRKRV